MIRLRWRSGKGSGDCEETLRKDVYTGERKHSFVNIHQDEGAGVNGGVRLRKKDSTQGYVAMEEEREENRA